MNLQITLCGSIPFGICDRLEIIKFRFTSRNYSKIFTARKRSLGQGNVFTPVCHSVHRGVCSRNPLGMPSLREGN